LFPGILRSRFFRLLEGRLHPPSLQNGAGSRDLPVRDPREFLSRKERVDPFEITGVVRVGGPSVESGENSVGGGRIGEQGEKLDCSLRVVQLARKGFAHFLQGLGCPLTRLRLGIFFGDASQSPGHLALGSGAAEQAIPIARHAMIDFIPFGSGRELVPAFGNFLGVFTVSVFLEELGISVNRVPIEGALVGGATGVEVPENSPQRDEHRDERDGRPRRSLGSGGSLARGASPGGALARGSRAACVLGSRTRGEFPLKIFVPGMGGSQAQCLPQVSDLLEQVKIAIVDLTGFRLQQHTLAITSQALVGTVLHDFANALRALRRGDSESLVEVLRCTRYS